MHPAHRGGVNVNHHTLSDFRNLSSDLLNGLLTQTVAVLIDQGLVEMKRVAQDGMKVRASAGASSFRTRKRLKELGIRVALGAQRKEVLQAALGRAVRLLAIGSVAGLLLGILASRVLAFIVYQATPRDPLVLAGVVLAMALLGLVATWIPAQRAMSVNPLILLREE